MKRITLLATLAMLAFSAQASNDKNNSSPIYNQPGAHATGNGGEGGDALSIAGANSAAEAKANAAAIAAQQQGQAQGQQQAAVAAQQQGIDRSGNSANDIKNSATGGASNVSSKNSNTNKTGDIAIVDKSQVAVDASDRSSSSYKATAWAPIIHGPAAPALASANLIVTPTACGPRVEVVAKPVQAHRFGVLFDSKFENGVSHEVVPAADPFIVRGGYQFGHQVYVYTAVVGTSSSGSFSVGGFGKDGNGGQGGGATSGGVQQVVQNVVVRDCVFAAEVK